MNKDVILGLLRHLLTVAGGSLIAAHPGILGQADVDTIVGAVVTVAAVAWSVVEKVNRQGAQING